MAISKSLVTYLSEYAYQWSATHKFELASGHRSDEYLDCKTALSRPDVLRVVSRMVLERRRHHVAAVGGLSMGADPIAIGASLASAERLQLRWFSVRKEAKQYGDKGRIIGAVDVGTCVMVVDDVLTTGDSTIQAIEQCRHAGLVVGQVLVMVDRQEFGALARVQSLIDYPVDVLCTKAEIKQQWVKDHK